jgi:hypothetical protein
LQLWIGGYGIKGLSMIESLLDNPIVILYLMFSAMFLYSAWTTKIICDRILKLEKEMMNVEKKEI